MGTNKFSVKTATFLKQSILVILAVIFLSTCGYVIESELIPRPADSVPVPQTISGLVLWLDAGAITGLSDGSAVDVWPDSSDNGNNATQTGVNRPTFRTGIINGKPVVRFDGTNYLDITALNMQPATVFAVVKYEPPVANAPFLGNDTSVNEYFGYHNNIIYYYSTIANMNVADPTPTIFQIITGHAQPAGSNSSIRINGSQVVSGSYNWGASTFIYVGRRNNTTERFKGDIADILIYSTNLSSTEIDQIEDYLSTKYSISMP